MNNLPKELIFDIIKFLPNYDIFQFYKINKRCNKVFIDYDVMIYCMNRKHPVVFNGIDNYCYKCNLTLTILTFNEKLDIITCNHF